MEVRAKELGFVEACELTQSIGLRGDGLSTQLQVPEGVEAFSGVIIVETDQSDQGGIAGEARHNFLDQPLAVSRAHELSGLGKPVGMRGEGGD